MSIEDLNYYRDSRVRARKAELPTITWDDGTEELLPWKYEVCDICNGHGTHVNPSIDAGGLSSDMMDDPDFMEGYMSGDYDVVCNQCEGKRVVPVVDELRLTKEQRERMIQQQEEDARDWAEHMAELRMGC